MRRLVLVAVAFVSQVRPAAACPCPSPAWTHIRPVTESPIPRDGVLTFERVTGEDACLDELAPFLDVTVTDRDGAPVAGDIELVAGAHILVFRPDEPWQAGGSYHARVRLDNLGLDPELSPDCADPVLVSELDFDASPEFSPPLPEIDWPDFVESVTLVDADPGLIVCCPNHAPERNKTSCDGAFRWPEGACAPLYESVSQWIVLGALSLHTALYGQLLYEVVIDGTVASRGYHLPGAMRNAPACAVYEAYHLGTGERVRSAEACTPPGLAARLGPRLRDVAAELDCDEPVLCGAGGRWDPDACTPYDPANPPPPPAVPAWPDTLLPSDCLETPEEPDDTATDTSGTGEPATDTAVDRGCSCDQSSSSAPSLLALALLCGWTRRRSR